MRTLLIAVILFSSTFLYSQTTTSKQTQIMKMMEMVGTKKLLDNMKVTLKQSYAQKFPDKDQHYWDEFFDGLSSDRLVSMIVPIYDKHFTEEDIKAMIAFYESPVGKKMIEKLPLIMQESMVAGQQWAEEIGQKVQEKQQSKKD
jgi:uncharacterized protein